MTEQKKILYAGLFHETHTFLKDKTTKVHFEKKGILFGDAIIQKHQNESSTCSGFLEKASEYNWDVIPSCLYSASPGGMVEQAVVDEFIETFFQDLNQHINEIDAIFLTLHGAMVSEMMDDVEGEILKRIHALCEKYSKKVLVAGVLDLHCNFSKDMAEYSNILVAYRKNPHTDAKEMTMHAADLLQQNFEKQTTPKTFFRATNLIFSPKGVGTDKGPMLDTLLAARQFEKESKDIQCINIFAGFSYADIPDCGFSISLITTGSAEEAENVFDAIEKIAIDQRDAGHPQDHSITKAIQMIQKEKNGPILLIEPSDNIGGGTPGDGTGALEAIIQHKIEKSIAIINDPEIVQNCIRAGVGSKLNGFIGAKVDDCHGNSLNLDFEVCSLSDGKFELENKQSHLASMNGHFINMGPCAVIKHQYGTILLTTNKTPPMDIAQLRSQGIKPEDAFVIVIKAAVSHKAAYDPIATKSIYVDTPGLGTSNLNRLPYTKVKRPKFPLDPID